MMSSALIASEEKVTISIDGMSCDGCVNKVTSTLEKTQGVKSAEVKLEPGSAIIVFDDQKADSKKLMETIAGLGYKANLGNESIGAATHCEQHKVAAVIKTPAPKSTKTGCDPAKCKITSCPANTKAADIQKRHAKTETRHDDSHICSTIKECKELTSFYDAMHPMREALSAGDYNSVRNGYELLVQKAEAVVKMQCDKKCLNDVKNFDKLRENLLIRVKDLGKTLKKNNNEQLAKAFDKIHDTYVKLGTSAK